MWNKKGISCTEVHIACTHTKTCTVSLYENAPYQRLQHVPIHTAVPVTGISCRLHAHMPRHENMSTQLLASRAASSHLLHAWPLPPTLKLDSETALHTWVLAHVWRHASVHRRVIAYTHSRREIAYTHMHRVIQCLCFRECAQTHARNNHVHVPWLKIERFSNQFSYAYICHSSYEYCISHSLCLFLGCSVNIHVNHTEISRVQHSLVASKHKKPTIMHTNKHKQMHTKTAHANA